MFTTFTNQYGVPICTSALGSVRSLILTGSIYVKLSTNKKIEGLVMELQAVSLLSISRNDGHISMGYNEATSSGQRITQHVIVHAIAIAITAKMYEWERPACSSVCEGEL